MLRVDNNSGLAPNHYQLEFGFPTAPATPPVPLDQLQQIPDVLVEDVVSNGFGFDIDTSATQVKVGGVDLAGQPVVIPIGDVDGDAVGDYILSIADDVTDPRNGANATFARIIFGNDPRLTGGSGPFPDPVLLQLPAPVLTDLGTGRSVISSPGDYDGDGVGDIAIGVANTVTPEGTNDGVYLVFGGDRLKGIIDVVTLAKAEPTATPIGQIEDTFTRADARNLGTTEEGGSFIWDKRSTGGAVSDVAGIENGQLVLDGSSGQAILQVDAADVAISVDTRFGGLLDPSDSNAGKSAGFILRKPNVDGSISNLTGNGQIDVNFLPNGGLVVRQNGELTGSFGTLHTLFSGNPFIAQAVGSITTFQGAGSLPTSINGLPFDADSDGVLEDDEPFKMGVRLEGTSLEFQINGQTITAIETLSSASITANYMSLTKNSFGGGALADIIFDNLLITDAALDIRPDVVAIREFDFSANLSVASAGDLNHDQADDLLVSDTGGTHFYAGQLRDDWLAGDPVILPNGTGGVIYDFASNNHGFFLDQDHANSASWRRTGYGITFTSTNSEGYVDDGGGFFNSVFAYAETPTIDLTQVSAARLSFDSLLETENSAGVDIAKVQIITNPGGPSQTIDLEGVNNQPGGLLADNGVHQRISIPIPEQFLGQNIVIRFDFDTIDLSMNGFYGWGVDNIHIDTIGLRATSNPLPHAGTANVEGLGSVDGDLFDEFGVLSLGLLDIYRGETALAFPPASPWATVPVTGDRIIPLGDYDGDGFHDVLVTGDAGSTFVFGGATGGQPDFTVVSVAAGNLLPIGNFDADAGEFGDFAAAVLESTATVAEASPNNQHQTVAVFLGGPVDVSFGNLFQRPALVLESSAAVFTPTGQQPADTTLIGTLGNQDGADGDDLVFATPSGSVLHTVFGNQLSDHTPATDEGGGETDPLPQEFFEFDLAIPLAGPANDPNEITGVDLVADVLPDLNDAFTLEGIAENESIQRFDAVGDVNDDGFLDFAVGGEVLVVRILWTRAVGSGHRAN